MIFILFVFSLCYSFFFFFKQKTAYEMRISDWSSDVCSSDLRLDRDPIVEVFNEACAVPDVGSKRADARCVRNLFQFRCRRRRGAGQAGRDQGRSEERSVGKEGVSTCGYRW